MSPAARDALLHMLGLDKDHATPWRDHYVGEPADRTLAELVDLGFARHAPRPAFLPAGDVVWVSTADGRAEAIRLRPRRKPSSERYHRWLCMRECCPDLAFGDFLRQKLYRVSP